MSFEFSGPNGIVANGDDNLKDPTKVDFFAHQAADGFVYLFLDDAGGGFEDNHDDLVVRLSAVPLPAGAVLLLAGLGALALRRKLS